MAKDFYRFIQTAVGQQYNGPSFYPTTIDIQPSIKCGWLRKQGGVVKSWQKRWFTIKGDYIYYFATLDEIKSPLGVIFLPGSHVIEHPFSATDSDKFLFEIAPDGLERQRMAPTHETYLLAAESDEERKDWIKAIKQVLYATVGGAIFGRSLEDTLRFEMVRDRKRKVPEIVQLCADYLMQKGLNEEGIFRLPGRSILIKKMCDAFDRGERPEIDVPEMDIHTAASLLKAYLRDLPGPLIPVEFYESVMRIIMREMPVGEDKALARLNELIRSIPIANYNVLQYICQFLKKVASLHDKNKMTAINLATIFVQSFIRPEEDDPALLMATASSRTMATLVLIERSDHIFNVEYTAEGAVVVVDDLLGLDCSRDSVPDESGVAPMSELSLNPDLCGLDINGSEPLPEIRRHNVARSIREASLVDRRTGLLKCRMQNNNRRGAIIVQNHQNSNDNDEIRNEVESEKPSNKSAMCDEVQPSSDIKTDRSVAQPVAPPRTTHQKSKVNVKPTDKSPATSPIIENDNVAVETLINIDTKSFKESELHAHIERLCQELVVRQKIIEDLTEQAQLAEQKHEKQTDALLTELSKIRRAMDKYLKQLHAYEVKYGSLD